MAFLAGTFWGPPHYALVEFDEEWGQFRPLEECVSIDSSKTWLPTSGYVDKPRKRLPDVIQSREVILISLRFRDLIETLCPAVHQFFPFALRDGPSIDAAAHPYFILNVTTRLDYAFSETVPENMKRRDFPPMQQTLSPPRAAFRSEVIKGHHLWRVIGGNARSSDFFLSNELVDLMMKSPKITGLSGEEYAEV